MKISDFIHQYGFVEDEYTGEIENTEYNAAPCPFLKYGRDNAVCTIYPVRPWICKGYPGSGTACIEGQVRA
jgi:Fe-S-cluster containining protein